MVVMSHQVGRNEPCPCGSGKKYKKCCYMKTDLEFYDKHYFRLKGETAEEFVHSLAKKSFLEDWCYLNPKLPDGKELCDLLIIFEDIAIIWQIKDLKVNEAGEYNNAKVEKNLRQLVGARRTLIEINQKIKLDNCRRGKEEIDTSEINKVFLISALLGEGEGFSAFYEEYRNNNIHTFTRCFSEVILNELDTISDFTKYIEDKENFLSVNRSIVLLGGEEELLAHYLSNDRSFNGMNDANMVLITEGSWNCFIKKPEYKKKNELNKISYCWDGIINRAHEGTRNYEIVARELARTTRFERRILSEMFIDGWKAAHNAEEDLFRRITTVKDITYCFLFMDDDEPRERRREMLGAICMVARGIIKENKKVIGIATEKNINPTCAYDFCLLFIPEWNEILEQKKKILQEKMGIFLEPNIKRYHAEEYPRMK
jgi:hypothetical protein